MNPNQRQGVTTLPRGSDSPAQAWARAIALTAAIAGNPTRTFPTVIDEIAERSGATPALLSDRECLTYDALVARSHGYARWALHQGIQKGDVVCLLMPNRPEYVAIWLGITRIGGVVALLNTHLTGRSLAHCIDIAAPKHLIADAELVDVLNAVRPDLAVPTQIWSHGDGASEFHRIDREVERYTGGTLRVGECDVPTIEDRALYIFTSGTTGLPKAAIVSHARVMQWTQWFAGMMNAGPSDRMYNCLPMYHSVGGVLATGAVLAGGGSVVIRDAFSARHFWHDIARWDCTLFQYIGELCRYLLKSKVNQSEAEHRLRLCCGNGLRSDVWEEFKSRFRIPHILEFYAATEGNVSLFNVEGKPGAIGRVPPFLAHRCPATLVKFDIESSEPLRDEEGFCIRCVPNEVGEAIGQLFDKSSNIGRWFEGYADANASDQKLLRDVFEPGDTWFRTGDLMRRDDHGYFYFIDRIGDTFRWKGENVATTEVAEAICAFRGVAQANVYGVAIPGTDGRAGMATLVTEGELDLAAFRKHVIDHLPPYARPVFLRIRDRLEVTTTFKYTKNDLTREGYNPSATSDTIYYYAPERKAFIRVDEALYASLCMGHVRL